MDYIIREATPDDSPAIIAFMHSIAKEADIDIVITPEEFIVDEVEERRILAEFAAATNSVYLIAVVGNDVVGFLCCKGLLRKRVAHVTSLSMSVRKDWRNKKVGQALMKAVLQWAAANPDVHRVELSVTARNARAIHLYEKFGFKQEGYRSHFIKNNDIYLDDIVMAILV